MQSAFWRQLAAVEVKIIHSKIRSLQERITGQVILQVTDRTVI
jgi:hypothetical protein